MDRTLARRVGDPGSSPGMGILFNATFIHWAACGQIYTFLLLTSLLSQHLIGLGGIRGGWTTSEVTLTVSGTFCRVAL